MGTAILYRQPVGVVGEISRQQDTEVEAIFLNPDNAPTKYGAPVKFVSGKGEAIEAGDAAADFRGIVARTAPSISGSTDSGFNDNVPNPATAQALVRRGYVLVKCAIGTPTRGGAVYMRTVADTGKLVGDLEATFDNGGEGPDANVLLVGVTWASEGKDSDGTAEIRIA